MPGGACPTLSPERRFALRRFTVGATFNTAAPPVSSSPTFQPREALYLVNLLYLQRGLQCPKL